MVEVVGTLALAHRGLSPWATVAASGASAAVAGSFCPVLKDQTHCFGGAGYRVQPREQGALLLLCGVRLAVSR